MPQPLQRDIRCSWNPKLFHDPPDGTNLVAFSIKIRVVVMGFVGYFYQAFDSGDLFFPSAIGDQDGGVPLGSPCVTGHGFVLFRVLVDDPPVTNNDPPPSECVVAYGDPGSGYEGFNEADMFPFNANQELIDHCALQKWHIPKPV